MPATAGTRYIRRAHGALPPGRSPDPWERAMPATAGPRYIRRAHGALPPGRSPDPWERAMPATVPILKGRHHEPF